MNKWVASLPCLFHVEQYTLYYCVSFVTNPGFILPDQAFRAACLLSGLEYESIRWFLFVQTYPMVHITGLPFPPPFDDIWDLNNECWYSLWDVNVTTGIPLDNDDCEALQFKGNQGGAWPVRWP